MSKGMFEKKGQHVYKTVGGKSLVLLLALVLLVGCMIGGTVAWLTAKTPDVTNVFTTSDINVTLEETTKEYQMVPGWTIAKDPKATVTAGSEDCYLFVKVQGENAVISKNDNGTYSLGAYIVYDIADGWNTLDESQGIYYRVIDDGTKKGVAYSILGKGSYTETVGNENVTIKWEDNQVATKPSVTKQMMEAINNASSDQRPTLTFTAYAVQLYETNDVKFDPEEAWAKVAAPVNPGN